MPKSKHSEAAIIAALQQLVADLSLDKDALQSVIRKNVWSAAGLQVKVSSEDGLRKCIRPLSGTSPGHNEKFAGGCP